MKTYEVEMIVKKRMKFRCIGNCEEENFKQIENCLRLYGVIPIYHGNVESCNIVDGEKIVLVGKVEVMNNGI